MTTRLQSGFSGVAQIDSLNALRGIAAAVVLVFHCAQVFFRGEANVPFPLDRGYLAVDLFFLLSGFVLMHADGAWFDTGIRARHFMAFLWSRFARTYPVHVVVLASLLPLYGSPAYGPQSFTGIALLHNLLLTQGPWLDYMSWNYGAWSISAEWHAYLVFPLLVASLWNRRPAILAVVALTCLTLLAAVVLKAGNTANLAHGIGTLVRCLAEFVLGMILYRAYREGWLARFIARDRSFVACALGVLVLAFCPGSDIAMILALAALLLAAAHNDGEAVRALGLAPLQYLGEISYSLYMVQMVAAVLLALLNETLGTGPLGAVMLAVISFALAIPVSRYVEYPMRRIIRGWARPLLALKPAKVAPTRAAS